MARKTVNDDYSDKRRQDAHVLVDTMFDLRIGVIIAGKQSLGGLMWQTFGDKRSIYSLARKLNDMAEKQTL